MKNLKLVSKKTINESTTVTVKVDRTTEYMTTIKGHEETIKKHEATIATLLEEKRHMEQYFNGGYSCEK